MERRILIVTCFGHFLSHFNMLVFPAVVLPLAGLLHVSMSEVLGLSFMQYLLFGIMALPWGMTGDRWGGKKLMVLMFLGSGLCGLAAATFIQSPTLFSVALAGIGFFSAIYHPIGLGLITKGVRRMSVALGYNGVFGGLGLVLAPLLSGVMVWWAGPKAAYLLLAGLNIFGMILMAMLPLQEPEKTAAAGSHAENGLLGAFLILLVAMMLGGIAYRAATVILPTYLELQGKGILEVLSHWWGNPLSGNLVATTITALIYTVGMVGQYVGGHVGERCEPRYSYLVFHAICIPVAFLMAFTQNLVLVGLAILYFFCLLGMQPVENTLVATYAPRRLHHSAFGMKFILTFGVGSFSVKMLQYIEARWNVEASFVALGIVSILLVATISLLIRHTQERQAAGTSLADEPC